MADGQEAIQQQQQQQIVENEEVDEGEGAGIENQAPGAATGEGGLQSFLNNDVYPTSPAQNGNVIRDGGTAASGSTTRDGGIHEQLERRVIPGAENSINKLGPKDTEPTKEERQEAIDRAAKAFEANPLSKFMTPEDRALALKMQAAVLSGDTKALGELVAGLKDNPEKLAALSKAIQDNLQKQGSSARLEVTPDGNLLMFQKGASHAVQIGADGKVQVKAIEHGPNGSLDVLNDRTVVRPVPADLAKRIADQSVNQVNWNGMFSRMGERLGDKVPFPPHFPNPGPIIRQGGGLNGGKLQEMPKERGQ